MAAIKPMVDANVLVYAHNQDSPFYPQASTLLTGLVETGGFCVSSLVLHEFFSVITDGRKMENPLSSDTAFSIIGAYGDSEVIDLLPADESAFFSWLRKTRPAIKRYGIYDAFIAYTMFENGVSTLYTNNSKDFKKFEFVEAINPFSSLDGRTADADADSSESDPIPYGRQSISEKDIAAVCRVLRSDWLTQGPVVEEFERAIADYCGAKYAVAVANGTVALHLACLAAGLGSGDEGITTPISFLATANCMIYCGARPVFADIEPGSWNIDPAEIEKKVTAKTKVVIPVHFAGLPCDMAEIREIADRNGLTVIEDACHAIGAQYQGRKVGGTGTAHMTCFSFHPVKHLTTGEGGAILTDDEELNNTLRRLRHHGVTKKPALMTRNDGPWYYEALDVGYNGRLTDFQCALGLSQLSRLDGFLARRRQIADRYREELSGVDGLTLQEVSVDRDHAYHLFVFHFDPEKYDRLKVFRNLQASGIAPQVHYVPLPGQPAIRNVAGDQGPFPNAMNYYDGCISLPMFPALTEEGQAHVISALKRLLQDGSR